jgi:hypothetical protein
MHKLSHRGTCPPARLPRRRSYPDLSPRGISVTKAPTIEAGLALWPHWAEVPCDRLNLDLFDDDGRHILEGRES